MPKTCEWKFPCPRTHAGMLQGNGVIGAMIWGEGGVLRLTFGRADFWDHRGGFCWTERQSFAAIRKCLEAGDEAGIRKLFDTPPVRPGDPPRPSVLPIGRIDLDFGAKIELRRGRLRLDDGTILLSLQTPSGAKKVRLALDMDAPVFCALLPKGVRPKVVRAPAWEHVGEHLKKISFEPPKFFDGKDGTGWMQECPADPPLCVCAQKDGRELFVAVVRGDSPKDARARAAAEIGSAAKSGGFGGIEKRNRAWWKSYWRDVPRLDVPNENLRFLYEYGMYKFAGLTHPGGVPATLQGPWVEEYQMPPWSNDYHFNINVQMCYWPAYRGNRLSHLKPLFEMIGRWKETLRRNARMFLDIADGLMLPHAVDDRGTCMGAFWTGCIDHGCTAWVAQMMWLYYRYTMDEAFLRETAYPFMAGAMRVYEGMMDKTGDSWSLPVTVSPEYGGSSMSAWGRNASFQLACVHMLGEALLAASEVLGEKPQPVWKEILRKLPKACLMDYTGAKATIIPGQGRVMIGLWEGENLAESHRHHSHLGAIVPFDAIDPADPQWKDIVEASIAHWIYRGMGLWSGWCMPWASMIHSHLGNADMAELTLEIWQRVFTNERHGTLHDAGIAGFSLIGCRATRPRVSGEIMQMDAGMSCVTAILEMLLHSRRGIHYLFAGAPSRWEEVSFEGIRAEGAFLVSAARAGGEVGKVKLESLAGGTFRLANPWNAAASARSGRKAWKLVGPVLDVATEKGETIELTKA